MISLELTRGSESESCYLRLPTTPAGIGEVFSWLDETSTDISLTRIIGALCPVTNITGYIRNADVNSSADIYKLNRLAEKISVMSDKKRDIFSGALDAESVNGLDDVLRIADSLDDYILLPHIDSDRELGEFLVDTGYKDFPERVHPYLDYAAIGAEYFADHGGAFGQGGYVRRKTSLEQISEERPALITIHLCTLEADGITRKTYRLSLPTTEEELVTARDKLDVDYFADADIDKIEFGKPYLEELIPQDYFCVEDANELALSIEEMEQQDGELLKYMSVLSVVQPETLADALQLAIDLDDYERVTENTYEYGKEALERLGADQELIDAIDGFIDFEEVGLHMMEEDDVRQTALGLVRKNVGSFPEPEQEITMGGM